MLQIQLNDSTVDALVKTYEWYIHLLGGEADSNIEFKVKGAIDFGLASLYADCLQLEAEEKRRREKARCKHRRVEERHKDFATIVYEESAPENWMNIIEHWNCEHIISPRHDKGVKPHWHIMLCFNEIKTDKEVGELFRKINGIGLVHVESRCAMMNYMLQSEGGD